MTTPFLMAFIIASHRNNPLDAFLLVGYSHSDMARGRCSSHINVLLCYRAIVQYFQTRSGCSARMASSFWRSSYRPALQSPIAIGQLYDAV